MATNNPFYAFPDDARPAFVAFDRRLENAWLSVPNDSWINTPGLVIRSTMPAGAKQARFVMPSGIFEFKKLKERPTHFTHLSALFADVDWERYQEGVQEEYGVIQTDPNFHYWDKKEIQMAVARRRAHAKALADVFNNNPVTVWEKVAGKALFAVDHNVNLVNADLGTQANLVGSTALSATNWNAMLTTFMGLKSMQGDAVGQEPNAVIVPTGLKQTARGIFDPLYLASGANSDNRFRDGSVKIIHIPQLTDQNAWYPVRLGDDALPPLMLAQGNNGNMRVKIFGETSEMYLHDDMLGASYLDDFAAYGGLYYNIMKYTSDAI